MTGRTGALLGVFLLAIGAAAAGPQATPGGAGDAASRARAALDGFDGVASSAVRDLDAPGLAVAVVAGGETVYAAGFGYRNFEDYEPVTADTLFAIGSATKAMTATVLGMLVDDGVLDWDEPLRTYLPEFRLSDECAGARITPRDLLTHGSGLPAHDLVWYRAHDVGRRELVEHLAYLESTADLRQRYQFNDLMFMTAGYLTERLVDASANGRQPSVETGPTWEEIVHRRLLGPLGMTRTNFSAEATRLDPDHARPYRKTDDGKFARIPFPDVVVMGPALSVYSTVSEMGRWLRFNLDGGRAGEERLIRSATLDDIQSPRIPVPGRPERSDVSADSYAMGWRVTTWRGHRRLSHEGGLEGFSTSVVLFPDDGVGMVAFTNATSPLPDLVNRTLADRLLGLDPVDWIGGEAARRARAASGQTAPVKGPPRVPDAGPSHDLADYAGEYADPGYGRLRIEVADADARSLRLEYHGVTAPLEHWHYDVWSGAEVASPDDEAWVDRTFVHRKFLFRSDVAGRIVAVVSAFEPEAGPVVFVRQPSVDLRDPGYLRRFVGMYEFGERVLDVFLSGDDLMVSAPGRRTRALEPDAPDRFTLRGDAMVTIEFETDAAGRAVRAFVYEPGAAFELERRAE